MWNIFIPSSKKFNLSWMQVDIHSHILPGLDDGSPTVEKSISLLEQLMDLGLNKFYFTPHIFQELYPNNEKNIKSSFDHLRGTIEFDGGYAAEYMVDRSFDSQLCRPDSSFLCLPGNYMLIEMSYMQESRTIEKNIFELQTLGYKPILAHPERYVFYHGSIEPIKRLRDLGCLLQMNLLSITGYYGSNEKKAANQLIDNKLIDLLGTDVHHERHVYALQREFRKKDLSILMKYCPIKNQELFGRIESLIYT